MLSQGYVFCELLLLFEEKNEITGQKKPKNLCASGDKGQETKGPKK